jgi:hypothetical protein
MGDTSMPAPVLNAIEMGKALTNFHTAYGRFMQHWARLEEVMFYWFQWLSAMPELRARAIFYSSKNFAGRADLLEAATQHAEVGAAEIAFAKQAIKKCIQFNSFRNSATHGEAVHDARPTSSTYLQYLLVQGKSPVAEQLATAITVEILGFASDNVRELSKIMFDVLQHAGQIPGYPPELVPSPDKCLEQVLALPNRACQNRLAPSEPKPKLRRKASRE